jgi:hypothetical protein
MMAFGFEDCGDSMRDGEEAIYLEESRVFVQKDDERVER